MQAHKNALPVGNICSQSHTSNPDKTLLTLAYDCETNNGESSSFGGLVTGRILLALRIRGGYL